MEPSREPTLEVLSNKDFIPEKYVRDLSQSCVGGPELRRLRKKVQSLSEKTNTNLKKNVYDNYMQFIDTAKEISHLESEMYQLSHLLSEQKSLLAVLYTTSILGDETPIIADVEAGKEGAQDPNEENRQKMASILEKVENCKEQLEHRVYLHEGDLLEVDPVDNNTIKSVHVYLFTDGFMVTDRNRGLMKYSFENMYDVRSLGVVNVREIGTNKHQFKLLIFPQTRVFQCTSSSNKKEWLDKFDQAKKARLAQEQQKRESIVDKSPSRTASIDSPSYNPFDELEEETSPHPDWFVECPDELDVCVAQRHFEEALALLQRATAHIAAHGAPDHALADVQRKVEQRHRHLTEVLMRELAVSADKSPQGGLRAARRAVRLLNRLGRARQACALFLKLCSSMLRQQYRRVKREGSTTMYVSNLASIVFTNMCHMTEEFLRAFPSSSTCFSAYVVWASGEISIFTNHFIKQAFMPQTSLSSLTDCVVLVRSQCERLCNFGVDLCYQLDGALRAPLEQALRDARDKAVDAAKVRALEDKWIPLNMRAKPALARLLQEFADAGLPLAAHVTGDVWVQLTANTIAFARLFLATLGDCMRLKTTELVHRIDEVLYDVLDAQARHVEATMRAERRGEQREFVRRNGEFLLVTVVKLAAERYRAETGLESVAFERLQKEYAAVISGVSPTNRSTKTKYSSEFL